NVGIDTPSPVAALHVSGGPLWTDARWTKSIRVNDRAAIEFAGSGSSFGIGASSRVLYFMATTPGAETAPALYALQLFDDGTAEVPVLRITGGSDLAEPFDVNGV